MDLYKVAELALLLLILFLAWQSYRMVKYSYDKERAADIVATNTGVVLEKMTTV